MGNIMPLPAELEQDDRSFKGWVEDQGLEFVTKGPKLEKVKLVIPNARGAYKTAYDLNVARTVISFTPSAAQRLKATHVMLGTGVLDGEQVLLIRPVKEESQSGYKLTKGTRVTSLQAVGKLLDAGLKIGRYRIQKAKGGYVAKLVKESA